MGKHHPNRSLSEKESEMLKAFIMDDPNQNKTKLARDFDISVPTLYRELKRAGVTLKTVAVLDRE